MICKDEAFVMDKLCSLGDEFRELCSEKKYDQAMFTYYTASIVAIFMEAEDDTINYFFGFANSAETDEKGLFDRDMVEKARWDCIQKNKSVPYIEVADILRIMKSVSTGHKKSSDHG